MPSSRSSNRSLCQTATWLSSVLPADKMVTAHATVGQIKSYKGNEGEEERGGSYIEASRKATLKCGLSPWQQCPVRAVTPWNRNISVITINTNLFRLRLDIIVEAEMQEKHWQYYVSRRHNTAIFSVIRQQSPIIVTIFTRPECEPLLEENSPHFHNLSGQPPHPAPNSPRSPFPKLT